MLKSGQKGAPQTMNTPETHHFPDHLGAQETANEWGISRATIKKWYNAGRITRKGNNRKYFYPQRDIANAFYNSESRYPPLEVLIEEAQFLLDYGKNSDHVITRLAQAYKMEENTVRYKLQDHFPQFHRNVGAQP